MTGTVTQLPRSHHDPLPPGQVNGVQFADAAGIPYKKVDWLTRAGYLHTTGPPSPGSGYQRAYPTSEIPVARLVGQLLDAGLTVAPAVSHARALLEHGHTRIAGITIHLPQT